MDKEIWKPVVGYEGLYEISSKGKLKRLEGETFSVRKGYKLTSIFRPEHIIKSQENINGYLHNSLYKFDGTKYVRESVLIHRLVAEAFIGSQPSKSKNLVIFINGNKKDLNYKNLKWANNSEAQINARKNGTRGPNPSGWDYQHSIAVNQLEKGTSIIIETFGSISKASEKLNIPTSNICKVLKGKRGSAGGYSWELFEE